MEIFYAFFDRIRKKYDTFIFRQSVFDNLEKIIFDGQSQNRYRKLVDVVVCSNNICTKAFYRYILHST